MSFDLKSSVIEAIRTLQQASVTDIIEFIEEEFSRDYAMSTISTVVKRLEEEGLIIGEKKRLNERKKTYFHLSNEAHKEEASDFLKSYYGRYGNLGLRHLSNLIGNSIDEKEINKLKSRLFNNEE